MSAYSYSRGPPPSKKPKFAERMMASMGWKEGQGLGTDGRGRLNPIETQLRPQGAGLGVVREKTKQAKEEEKREKAFRGEKVEDDTDSEAERRRRRKKPKGDSSDALGQGRQASTPGTGKKRKPKYITAEQVGKELEGLNIPINVLESAFDLAGKSTTYDSPGGFVAAQDDSEKAKSERRIQLELVACAESRAALNERKAYLNDTNVHLVSEMDRETEELEKTREVIAVVTSLQELSLARKSDWETTTARLRSLEIDYPKQTDLERYGIYDIVVATLHPLFKQEMAEWEPPEVNEGLLGTLESLQHLLGIKENAEENALTKNGGIFPLRRARKSTTPYETMIYNLFLPRLRTYMNNSWTPTDPSTLPDLLKRWQPLLPGFVVSHIMEQLLVPLLISELSSWKPSRTGKKGRMQSAPDAWIFPWLELLPAHHLDPEARDGLLVEVKRKFRSLLGTHPIESGPPAWLLPWKILLRGQFTTILTTRLVPRLATYLASPSTFQIDPSNQETYLPAFNALLSYLDVLSPSTMAQILVPSFFPQFISTLYDWLTSDEVLYAEVEQWYVWWKSQIPETVLMQETLWPEWARVFRLMIRAAEVGPARTRAELAKPGGASSSTPSGPKVAATGRGVATNAGKGTGLDMPGPAGPTAASDRGQDRSSSSFPSHPPPPPPPAEAGRAGYSSASAGQESGVVEEELKAPDITFKDVVEQWCEENDLLMFAMREAHESTGSPLFRITASADQKGGVVIYLRGDVMWARDKKDRAVWEAVGLDDSSLLDKASSR